MNERDNLPFEDEFEEDTPTSTVFITDDFEAEFAVEQIKAAREKVAKMEAWYTSQLDKVKKECERVEAFYTEQLNHFLDMAPNHVTKGGQVKYTLPSATLIRKPNKVEYQMTDKAKTLAWAKTVCVDAVIEKEDVSWSAVKQYIKDFGEIPDGVEPVEKTGELEVRLDG